MKNGKGKDKDKNKEIKPTKRSKKYLVQRKSGNIKERVNCWRVLFLNKIYLRNVKYKISQKKNQM